MSKPKLALIPSGYKSGKVYSILPNDATGDFDFTRQSIGTRVRKDGLIEEAKTEGSITNLVLNSEDFSTNWSNFNGASISTDQALAPDGTNTADKIVSNGTNYSFTRPTSNITVTNAKYYTASIYVKADVETVGYLRCDYGTLIYNRKFDLSAGTLSTGFDNTANIPENERIEELANGWYRVSMTNVVDTISFEMRIYCADGSASSGDSLFLWGAMVSEGALSDYIKTEGSQETKTVETFTDVPRLDWYNSNCPSLLLEPQRTNYALNSTQLHLNNTLTASGSTITKTGNYALAPDGTFTATRLQCTGTGSGYALLSVNGTNPSTDLDANGYYMSSVYVRSNTGTTQTIGFYGSSTQTIRTHEITNEWKRIQFLAYRPALSKYAYIGYAASISGVEADLDFLVWGGQTEIVDSYITSFIPTGTSTVTRLKDDCHLLSHTLFTDYPFTVYAKAKIEDVGNTIFSIYGGASNKYLAFVLSSSTQIAVYRRDATNNDSDFYNFTYSVEDTIKVAVAFINDTTYKLYINGTEIADVTSGLSVPFDNDDILLGQFRISGDDGKRNSIDDFRVYDYTLTDAELTELTTL